MNLDSHILNHQILKHGDERVDFSMKIIKKHTSAFRRQVHEAVLVEKLEKDGENILNSKGGFNRCSLPRLTISLGDKEHKEGDPEEIEMTDYEIEMQIRKMRRENLIRKRESDQKKADDDPDKGAPAQKKKRRWKVNFEGGRRRKQEESFEVEGPQEDPSTKRRKKENKNDCQIPEVSALAQARVCQNLHASVHKIPHQNIESAPAKAIVSNMIDLFEEKISNSKETSSPENINIYKRGKITEFDSNNAQDIHSFGISVGGQEVGCELKISSAVKEKKVGGVFSDYKASPVVKTKRSRIKNLPKDYVYRPVSFYFKTPHILFVYL